MRQENQTIQAVKEYYGKILKTKNDLQTSACCTSDSLPAHLREIVKEIHPEVLNKFYGCGSPIPSVLNGKTILDLGCGAGRDCFILAKLAGPSGQVLGVDMTQEQLEIAIRHNGSASNIKFIQGYIEDLESLGIKNNSIDVVVSNCVLNLSPAKERVFSEIFRVLKQGGELHFSDVFSGRRIPPELAHDPELIGECLGGALYIEDFRRLMARLGCLDYRVVSKKQITLNNPAIERKAGMIDFYSMTVRAFKLNLEDRCEDYGQVAYYLGTIREFPHVFHLDDHHAFETGKPLRICSNTASMLTETRYSPHFRTVGDQITHFGIFDCVAPAKTSPDFGSCC